MLPKVTTVITTHNRHSSFKKALTSVLKQTYKPVEIIVVDDCSNLDIAKKNERLIRKHNRVIYIKHKKNVGLAGARNSALKKASGKYISFLDDDDYWTKNYIKELTKRAEQLTSNFCLVSGKIVNFGSKTIKSIPSFQGSLKTYMLKGFTPPVSAQFYFTETLKEAGGYNELIKSGVDHDLWIRLAIKGVQVAPIRKSFTVPNRNISHKRITTKLSNRRRFINKSLKIWKNEIVSCFGKKFYDHFVNSYRYYLNKKSILQSLQKRQLKMTLTQFLDCEHKGMIVLDLLAGLFRGIYLRTKLLTNDSVKVPVFPIFPEFKN